MGTSRLLIPEKKFRAYLFDCDGTLADSMPLHYLAWRAALDPYGCVFTEEKFYATAGMPLGAVLEMLGREQNLSLPVDRIGETREAKYLELLPSIRPIPEVLEHVHAQAGKLPLAVVSGSRRDSVLRTLDALGIRDRFQAIVGAEDCAKGKPHPEPFLTAAARLGIAPADCLVFEDAEFGIQSAQAAGMAWVRVPGPNERKAGY